jgi:hypothetical protein
MRTTKKTIDLLLSPALVKGGKEARQALAKWLWRYRRCKESVKYINRVACWTGYPSK